MAARRKFSATHRKVIGQVMRAARKRKPAARRVSFTKDEKSTLRHVMQEHHGKTSTRRKSATRKTKGRPGRKPGFKHSPATIKKMKAAHAMRKRHNKRTATYRKGKTTRANRARMAKVRSHRKVVRRTVRRTARR